MLAVRCVKEDMSASGVLLRSRSVVEGIIDLPACNARVLEGISSTFNEDEKV
jgi:hypothetical protein